MASIEAERTPDSANLEAPSRSTSPIYAYYVLGVLCISNMFNQLDRLIFTMLMEPIKSALQFSDTQMSLLSGFSFVLFYSLFGIPIARWSDRWIRKTILAIGIFGWSVMTCLTGAAGNFWQMAAARAGVGIGESAGVPPAMSMIADYFKREHRPQAIAIYQAAATTCMLAGAPLIGWITAEYGWRMTFIALGVPGALFAAVIFLTVREPQRGASEKKAEVSVAATQAEDKAARSFWSALKGIFGIRSFVILFLAQVFTGFAQGITGTWTPAFFTRLYHIDVVWVGNFLAPLWGAAGILGALAGGFIAGRMVSKTGDARWMVYVPIVGTMIAIPLQISFIFNDQVYPAAWLGALGSCFLAMRTAPLMTHALDIVPLRTRALASAMMLLAISVLGQGFGPLFTGMVSDALSPTLGAQRAIQWAFALSPAFSLVAVVILFLNRNTFQGKKAEA